MGESRQSRRQRQSRLKPLGVGRAVARAAAWVASAVGLCAGCGPISASPPAPSPTSILSSTVAPTPPWSSTVPIRLVQNAIQLEARVNQRAPETFLLDSGAPTTIAPWLAAEAGAALEAKVEIAAPDDRQRQVPLTSLDSVSAGGLAFHQVGAIVDWVEAPNPVACLSTAGLFGATILQAGVWQVDFQAGRLELASRAAPLPGIEYAMRLPFHRADAAGSPRVRVDLGRLRNVSVLIDLGFNGALALPSHLYQEAGGSLPPGTPVQHGRGAATVLGDRSSRLFLGTLDRVRLGHLELESFPVLTGDAVSDVHIGIALLSHFRVTVDWNDDVVYLQRRSPEEALLPRYASYGFTPELRAGELVVGAAWERSDADDGRLRLGDRIVAIDGAEVDGRDFPAYCRLLDEIGLFGTRTTPLEVTVNRDGTTQTIRAERRPLRSTLPDEPRARSR